jgi:spermidine/putrescine-binding protein
LQDLEMSTHFSEKKKKKQKIRAMTTLMIASAALVVLVQLPPQAYAQEEKNCVIFEGGHMCAAFESQKECKEFAKEVADGKCVTQEKATKELDKSLR